MGNNGNANVIGRAGEQLAGITPGPKTLIEVNNRIRIPDALSSTTLKEVKNVSYISNTLQLRDFATYAKATGKAMVLYVRPTTIIAKTVLNAGWTIQSLW